MCCTCSWTIRDNGRGMEEKDHDNEKLSMMMMKIDEDRRERPGRSIFFIKG